MKNKIKLLLTLSFPLLILNCSNRQTVQIPNNQVVVPQKVPTQVQHQPTQIRRPTLGEPISVATQRPIETPRQMPTATAPVVITQPQKSTPRPEPIVQQNSKYGKSIFNKKFSLPNSIKETSGLIKVDNRLWTLNDSGGKAALYQINEHNGKIIKTISISNAKNRDWEDISYDDNYIYIGDFGNNAGTRKDLKIYKIPRASVRTQQNVRAEIIHFKYSDQRNFSSRAHKHNYDCEAMVASNGKLYLFSKNWQNNKTRLYELNTQAGRHTAKHISSFNTQGMVTGATVNEELDILLLSTYSSLLNVNVWAFSNYKRNNFFSGNKKQLRLSSPLQGQVEGITFTDNYKVYLSSEAFKKYIFSFDATLYEFDFSGEFE